MISNTVHNSNRSFSNSKAFFIRKAQTLQKDPTKFYRTSVNPQECSEFTENPVKFMQNLPSTPRAIVNYLCSIKNHYLRGDSKFEHIYVSHQTIAKEIGRHVDTVRVWLKELHNSGLIGMVYRHAKSSLYYLNSKFLDIELRIALKPLFPAFRGIPSKLLLGALLALSFNGSGKGLPHGFFDGTPSQSNYKENGVYKKRSLPVLYPSPKRSKMTSVELFDIRMTERRLRQSVITERNELRIRFNGFINKKTDREKIMEARIPSYIDEIKSLNLDIAGKVRLSVFSEDIIKHADEYMAVSHMVSNPFSYFASICNNKAQQDGTDLDYGLQRKLFAKYNIDHSTPTLLDNTINRWKGEPVKIPQAKKENHQRTNAAHSGGAPKSNPAPKVHDKRTGPSPDEIRENIRKQIEARKEREAKAEQFDRSGLDEYAEMVENNLIAWETPEAAAWAKIIVEEYRRNQASGKPFENPLLAVMAQRVRPNFVVPEAEPVRTTQEPPIPNYVMAERPDGMPYVAKDILQALSEMRQILPTSVVYTPTNSTTAYEDGSLFTEHFYSCSDDEVETQVEFL